MCACSNVERSGHTARAALLASAAASWAGTDPDALGTPTSSTAIHRRRCSASATGCGCAPFPHRTNHPRCSNATPTRHPPPHRAPSPARTHPPPAPYPQVYKNFDPRAGCIRKVAEEVFELVGRDPLIDVAVALEKAARADEYFISKKLYPNVDFYSGLVYRAMGARRRRRALSLSLALLPLAPPSLFPFCARAAPPRNPSGRRALTRTSRPPVRRLPDGLLHGPLRHPARVRLPRPLARVARGH